MARGIQPDDPGLIATTGGSGTVEFDPAWIADHQDGVLAILAEDYLPATLAVRSLVDGFETVQLGSGSSCVVTCRDTGGQGLGDVHVVLSRHSVPTLGHAMDYCATTRLPGSNTDTAIHHVVSDRAGSAQFRGLVPGTYQLLAWTAGYALVDGQPAAHEVLVPGETSLRFGALVAVVCRFEGDRPVNTRTVLPETCTGTGFAEQAVTMERNRLKARFNADVTVVGALQAPGAAAPFGIHTLFDQAGLQSFSVNARNPAEIDAPEVLRASPASSSTMQECQLIVLDPTGATPAIDGLYVCLDETEVLSSISIELTPGVATRLPKGRYVLKSRNVWVGRCLQAETIEVPGVNTVSLTQEFRHCRIWMHASKQPEAFDRCRVAIQAMGSRRVYSQVTLQPFEVWLPVGPCHIETSLPAREKMSIDVAVEPSARSTLQEIVVEVDP